MSEIKNTILYITGVEGVSRKFTLRRNTANAHEYEGGVTVPGTTYMGGSIRSKHILGVGYVKQNTFFMRIASGKLGMPSATQIEQRAQFSAVVAWVNAAMKDLTAVVGNKEKIQTAIAQNKRIGTATVVGNTYRGVYWDYAWGYASEHSGSVPSSYEFPNPA